MRTLTVLVGTLIGFSKGFLYQPGANSFVEQRGIDFLLQAKAAKKNKKKKTSVSSAGGFGKVAEKAQKEIHDFSAFPALEKNVAETLVPSTPELQNESGELPAEIYDRLNQIYGFPSFNYETSDEDDDRDSSKTSFDDLISPTGTTNDSTTKSETKMPDTDFADLLASATGGTNIPTSSSDKSPPKEHSTIDAISNLPPFTQMRVLHVDPLVIAVDDFFTEEECDRYVAMSTTPNGSKKDSPFQTNSMTVGKDALAKAQRTSTTWFHHYKSVPELMAKASRLVGLDGIDQWEEPQTVRYRRQEKFTWHLDALSPSEASSDLGGQRIATLLVYLTGLDAAEGGATIFRDLSSDGTMLKVQPKKGSALLFFPAAGGIPSVPFDIRTLHCGEAVDKSSSHDKWISQIWLRESQYTPSAPADNLHALAKDAIAAYSEK